jgi:hypothetical protein
MSALGITVKPIKLARGGGDTLSKRCPLFTTTKPTSSVKAEPAWWPEKRPSWLTTLNKLRRKIWLTKPNLKLILTMMISQ